MTGRRIITYGFGVMCVGVFKQIEEEDGEIGGTLACQPVKQVRGAVDRRGKTGCILQSKPSTTPYSTETRHLHGNPYFY
jgi:hypothetical protein